MTLAEYRRLCVELGEKRNTYELALARVVVAERELDDRITSIRFTDEYLAANR